MLTFRNPQRGDFADIYANEILHRGDVTMRDELNVTDDTTFHGNLNTTGQLQAQEYLRINGNSDLCVRIDFTGVTGYTYCPTGYYVLGPPCSVTCGSGQLLCCKAVSSY